MVERQIWGRDASLFFLRRSCCQIKPPLFFFTFFSLSSFSSFASFSSFFSSSSGRRRAPFLAFVFWHVPFATAASLTTHSPHALLAYKRTGVLSKRIPLFHLFPFPSEWKKKRERHFLVGEKKSAHTHNTFLSLSLFDAVLHSAKTASSSSSSFLWRGGGFPPPRVVGRRRLEGPLEHQHQRIFARIIR